MNWMGTTGCLLIVIAGTHHASAQSWGWFGPSDYEECAEKAAKEAPTRDGLAILLNSCQTKFEARRNPKGAGYVYYDSRMQRWFDVNGPTLSAGDKRQIEEAYQDHLRQEQEQQAKRQEQQRLDREIRRQEWAEYTARQDATTSRLEVLSHRISCTSQAYCLRKTITGTLKNGSAETITGVLIGWAVFPGAAKSAQCPSHYESKKPLSVNVSPGQTATFSLETMDGPAEGQFAYCVKVLSVDLSQRPQGNWWDDDPIYSGPLR